LSRLTNLKDKVKVPLSMSKLNPEASDNGRRPMPHSPSPVLYGKAPEGQGKGKGRGKGEGEWEREGAQTKESVP